MNPADAVHQFVSEMIVALCVADTPHEKSDEFVQSLIVELESTSLKHNDLPTENSSPPKRWEDVVQLTRKQRTDSLLSSILGIQSYFSWFDGNRFWPEEANKNFAEKIWGAFLVGDSEASFKSENRYVAILTIIDADTTYPLHQHQIEEMYYVVSGHAEWSHDGKDWVTLTPGEIFFNEPNEPHAIRTNNQALLFISFYLPPFNWERNLIPELL